jgi:hypothetical protein
MFLQRRLQRKWLKPQCTGNLHNGSLSGLCLSVLGRSESAMPEICCTSLQCFKSPATLRLSS